MKYHWTDGSEFRMSKFLQIKLHLACVIRGAHIGFHIVGILRTIFASGRASTTASRLTFIGRAGNTAQLVNAPEFGKPIERCIISTFRAAESMGFKGDFRQSEHLLRIGNGHLSADRKRHAERLLTEF